MTRKRIWTAVAAAGVAAAIAAAVAFSSGGGSSASGGPLRVVAAENFWGSIAAQLGGGRVRVTSIISDPATDPHDYEPTSSDARTIADAKLVVANGVGYDPWATKLAAANPAEHRIVLTVGDVVGVAPGGNPHRWYSPSDVLSVAAAITRDYQQLDPADAAFFAAAKTRFERIALAGYAKEIVSIRRRFTGVRVGASESIFAPLAHALGLDLVTPPTFLRAISEGTEPTAADLTTIDRQMTDRRIAVWVYNRQNSTPDVQRLTAAAGRNGIPVTTITETLTPPTATFQAWQVRQLKQLAAALARATAR
jgi:zinc/manganese transport system substrate-binding protein